MNQITQNTTGIIELIESKFEELKSKDLFEIKNLIKNQSDLISKLTEQVTKHESTIAILQTGMETLRNENVCYKNKLAVLDKKIDDLEQYGQRQCLRIDGVECKGKDDESSANIVVVVEDLMKEVGLNITPQDIDRAHRIGPVYHRDGKRYQTIIAKFGNFRKRTDFYRKRKQLKDKNKVKIRVDLTKSKYNLLKKINDLIYETKSLANFYAFADINCRIRIVDTNSDENCYVDCIEDFENFLSQAL